MNSKLFVALVVCFFGETGGLQCYECKYPDLNTSSENVCKDLKVKTCDSVQSKTFCGTFTFTDKEGGSYIVKQCLLAELDTKCKKGSINDEYDPKGREIMLNCCEGNLCNNTAKLLSGNNLFIYIVLYLVNYMFN